MIRKRAKKSVDKRKIKSNKASMDGITFASKLELFMYKALKMAKIKSSYEGEVITLVPSFNFPNKSFERRANGKGDMIDRGGKTIRAITYKPDFVGDGFYIECKGFANESFSMRYKLFKKYIKDNNLDVVLFKPQSQKECLEVVEQIKKMRNER